VYLLTIIDKSTRWFEAVPLRNMEASTCVDAFIASWVACFGVPETVTTDRGTQFTSALWSSACTSPGIKHVLTTAYHPQSNGMVECVQGSSRMPCVHMERVLRGTLIFHGCCWAYVLHLRRILQCLQLSWLLGHHWYCQDSSCTCQIPTCGRATASSEASFLCGGSQHTAGSFSQGGARVRACWRPAEAAGGPICRPLPGCFQGSKDLQHPGGPAPGDRVIRLPEASHRPGSSISC
jgi:hypothetical protein